MNLHLQEIENDNLNEWFLIVKETCGILMFAISCYYTLYFRQPMDYIIYNFKKQHTSYLNLFILSE